MTVFAHGGWLHYAVAAVINVLWSLWCLRLGHRQGFKMGSEASIKVAVARGRKLEREAIAKELAASDLGALRVVGEAMLKDGWGQ